MAGLKVEGKVQYAVIAPSSKSGAAMNSKQNVFLLITILFFVAGCTSNSQTSEKQNPDDLIIAASTTGENKKVISALKKGANINARNNGGSTPLILAAMNGNAQTVEILLQNGADPNAFNRNKATALIWAAMMNNDTKIAEELIRKNAAINQQTDTGMTALMIAAELGKPEIVKLLLDNEADSTLKNNNGQTACQLAKANRHKSVIEILCSV